MVEEKNKLETLLYEMRDILRTEDKLEFLQENEIQNFNEKEKEIDNALFEDQVTYKFISNMLKSTETLMFPYKHRV